MTSTTTTAPAAPCTEICAVSVLDVSSLRFRYGPANRTVSVLTASGQHLATVSLPKGTGQAEAAWTVLGEAAATARILAPDAVSGRLVAHSVALYNPFTAHVAWISPTGDEVTFTCPPTALRPEGLPVHAAAGPDGWVLLDGTGTPAGTVRDLGPVDVSRALAAHH